MFDFLIKAMIEQLQEIAENTNENIVTRAALIIIISMVIVFLYNY